MAGFDNDVIYGINADYSNALNGTGASTTGELLTNGQLWIGSTALNAGSTHINVGTFTSPDSSITFGYSSPNITATVTGGTTSVIKLTGNSGTANPTAGNINVITANATVKFVGAASTLIQDFGITNILLGSNGSSITIGNVNVGVGNNVLNSLTSGGTNVAVGGGAGSAITSGNSNTIVGANSGNHITTGGGNIVVGEGALSALTTGNNNVLIGNLGGNYTTSESNNILIVNSGVNGESNVIRIGTQGSGNNQQNQTFIAGVINTVSGRVVKVTTPGAYPYTTLTTDYVILVDTSAARTINLISSPVTGTTYRIKDNVGSAAANNITITPAAGKIDGAASYVINNNYGSIDLVYNGTQWNKF